MAYCIGKLVNPIYDELPSQRTCYLYTFHADESAYDACWSLQEFVKLGDSLGISHNASCEATVRVLGQRPPIDAGLVHGIEIYTDKELGEYSIRAKGAFTEINKLAETARDASCDVLVGLSSNMMPNLDSVLLERAWFGNWWEMYWNWDISFFPVCWNGHFALSCLATRENINLNIDCPLLTIQQYSRIKDRYLS